MCTAFIALRTHSNVLEACRFSCAYTRSAGITLTPIATNDRSLGWFTDHAEAPPTRRLYVFMYFVRCFTSNRPCLIGTYTVKIVPFVFIACKRSIYIYTYKIKEENAIITKNKQKIKKKKLLANTFIIPI